MLKLYKKITTLLLVGQLNYNIKKIIWLFFSFPPFINNFLTLMDALLLLPACYNSDNINVSQFYKTKPHINIINAGRYHYGRDLLLTG